MMHDQRIIKLDKGLLIYLVQVQNFGIIAI